MTEDQLTGLDEHGEPLQRGADDPSDPCFVVVDMAPARDKGEYFGDNATWPWRAIGDGETLKDALICARDYEHHDVCSHCGRSDGEESWRVYQISREAWELLTCGGAYEESLQPNCEFVWDADAGMFVTWGRNTCAACKGEGEFPYVDARGGTRRRACEQCEGSGSLNTWEFERDPADWIDPPESACLWSGAG